MRCDSGAEFANGGAVMSMSGRVTVLIPLYNRAKYIEKTINSVLEQDYPDVELIVIDDGSTDGGDKIVERLSIDHGFKILRHPGRVNKGQSAALNLGLTEATGEFIAILDSDDLFVPGKISAQVEFLRKHEHIGLVYGNGMAIDENGNAIYRINYDDRMEKSDPNEVLLDCYFLLPQNSLVRRKAYEKAGFFDESLRSGQDHDMLIRLCEVVEIAHQSIDSFRYRRHGESISATGTETRWRCGLVILEKARQRYPYKANTIRKRKAVVNFRLAQALWSKRKFTLEILLRLLYSAALDPSRAWRVLMRKERV